MPKGVLTTSRDANIGSIMGIRYPARTGEVLQFIKKIGLLEFVQTAKQLAKKYGGRFTPPLLLLEISSKQPEVLINDTP